MKEWTPKRRAVQAARMKALHEAGLVPTGSGEALKKWREEHPEVIKENGKQTAVRLQRLWGEWDENGRSAEIRAKMSAAHKARWERNRERYLEANRKVGEKRRGTRYRAKWRPARCAIYNQYGIRYCSIKRAAVELGLHERLIRLVLEGKRKHTQGYQFQLASIRYEDSKLRNQAKNIQPRTRFRAA